MLTEFCRKLGAPPPQAVLMAKQLLKRTEQLALERKQSREECLTYLLRLIAEGQGGRVASDFDPPDRKSE